MKKPVLSAILLLSCISLNAQNLIFHTKFDNGQAQDISGNGYDGVLSGGPVACPGYGGIANTALYFDGVNDRVELPSNSDFNLEKWTLKAMVRPDGFDAGTCQASAIIWHGHQFQSDFYCLDICDNYYDGSCSVNSNMETFGMLAGGSSSSPDFMSPWYDTSGFLQAGEWYCVVGTYDGSKMKLYVNGLLVEEGTWPNQYNYFSNAITYIGFSNEPGYPYWFKGAIDEIAIWDDALIEATGIPFCDTLSLSDTTSTASVTNTSGENNSLVIYPNPATDQITFSIADISGIGKVVILNNFGQVVKEQVVDSQLVTIDISGLPVGMYILHFSDESETATSRFFKN